MHRRDLFKALAAGAVIGGAGTLALPRPAAAAAGWRQFEIRYRLTLSDARTPSRLWVPVPQDALDYQKVVDLTWQSSGPARIEWDATSRAPIFATEWAEPTRSRTVTITARVATRNRAGFSQEISPEERALYLKATASSPTDGIVLAKAQEIIGTRTAPLDKARAIYDWVVDNTFRRGATRGCGLGNVAFMLESGDLGGKCADINSLYVGLARAAGLPARDFFGIRVAPSTVTKSLGASGDITKAQHCRAEVYIDGKGWLPVDPADVRKVVLEETLALGDSRIKALRERLFGSWEMNWVGFNYARDVTLPGQKGPPLGFLMYPYAEAPDAAPDPLDPASFAYAIAATEIT